MPLYPPNRIPHSRNALLQSLNMRMHQPVHLRIFGDKEHCVLSFLNVDKKKGQLV